MNTIQNFIQHETRRQFFRKGALGLGTAALASLMAKTGIGKTSQPEWRNPQTGGLPGLPHNAPKAKRAIYLFMSGAPSQLDMYDYKPQMNKLFDTDLPDEIRKGQRLTTMTSNQTRFPVVPSIFKFKKYDNGGDGKWVSELLPHTTKVLTGNGVLSKAVTPKRSITILPLLTSAPAINSLAEQASGHG